MVDVSSSSHADEAAEAVAGAELTPEQQAEAYAQQAMAQLGYTEYTQQQEGDEEQGEIDPTAGGFYVSCLSFVVAQHIQG